MNCRDFELRLESYLAEDLPATERDSAARHLRRCRDCKDLLDLALIAFEPAAAEATAPPADLVASVLSETVGSSCLACERLLCDYADQHLPDDHRALVTAHLDSCGECRDVAGALASLASDLPRLAEIEPDELFVDAVLAATLPLRVRLRRWWRVTWPRWVVRPRFAAEAAYVTTLILVLIFSVPGSPLQAMPGQAVELARRGTPARTISDPWGRLEAAIGPRVETLATSEGARAVADSWRTTVELGASAVSRSVELGERAYDWASGEFRTFWDRLASVLERAGETPSPADPDSDEEKS